MADIHKIIGFTVVVAFGVTAVWGLVAIVAKRDPGRVFWGLVAFSQVVIGLQVIVGVLLLLFGAKLPELLHLAYGVFAAGSMVWAQVDARQRTSAPWKPFAWAMLFAFGLSLRALQTGLGVA